MATRARSEFARELALENPDAFFLSHSGECFHNVTVTGGKQRSEGPLSMKRELRDVLAAVWTNWSSALRNEETQVLTLGREIKDHAALLDRLEEEKREAEKQAMTSGHLLRQLDAETGSSERTAQTCRTGNCSVWHSSAQTQQETHAATSERIGHAEEKRSLNWSSRLPQRRFTGELRTRRDLAAQNASQHVGTGGHAGRASSRSRSSVASALNRWSAEMRERVAALRTQMEAASAEIVAARA